MQIQNLTIVIQAGGQSRRMGSNKALIPFLGEPLIKRVLYRVKNLTDEILIISNSEDVNALDLPGAIIYSDVKPGLGPLGGVLTAFLKAKHDYVALLACDMPFADPGLIRKQMQLITSGNWDVVLPETTSGREPLHALYKRQACLPAVEHSINIGDLKLISWLTGLKVKRLVLEKEKDINAFINVNTPQQLTKAELLAQDGNLA